MRRSARSPPEASSCPKSSTRSSATRPGRSAPKASRSDRGPSTPTFATLELSRTPARLRPRTTLARALATVEAGYPFSRAGVFTTVCYGIPYFERLPGGMTGPLIARHLPRLLADPERFRVGEAVPGPSDVSPANPGVIKQRFNVPVRIEANDMLLILRSDSTAVIEDTLSWLEPSGRGPRQGAGGRVAPRRRSSSRSARGA